jgi:hypothetical protein
MIGHWEIFYTHIGVGRRISLTLTFYVRSHKNKQIELHDPT